MWFQNRLVCGLKRFCLQFATPNPPTPKVNPQSRITNSQGQIDEKLSLLVRLTKGMQSFREIGKEIDVSPSTLCRAYYGKTINASDLDKIKNWISKKNPFFEV